MDFPCYRYHTKKGTELFESKEELEKAGPGWVDSPAKLKDEEKEIDLSTLTKGGLLDLIESLGGDPEEHKSKKKDELLKLVQDLSIEG